MAVRFQPCIPKGISSVDLRNVHYRRMIINVKIRGTGTQVKRCLMDGTEAADNPLVAHVEGPRRDRDSSERYVRSMADSESANHETAL